MYVLRFIKKTQKNEYADLFQFFLCIYETTRPCQSKNKCPKTFYILSDLYNLFQRMLMNLI